MGRSTSEGVRHLRTGSSKPKGRCVAILTGFALSRNPRARKEAAALQAAGFRTVVFGAWTDNKANEQDRHIAARYGFEFRAVGSFNKGAAVISSRGWKFRARRYLGQKVFNSLGIANRYQLGYFVPELYREVRRMAPDLVIAHLEQSMWVANRLLKNDTNVGIDMEDWFSENVGANDKEYPRHFLRDLEGNILRRSSHRTCPSCCMSEALVDAFGCPPPIAIYNAFELSSRNDIDGLRKDRGDSKIPSLHWVSQTLGRDRGLEDLFGALKHVTAVFEIHLRANVSPSLEAWIFENVPAKWIPRIHLHKTVANDELLSRIAEHDIGFAGEYPYCANKDLTVSNKILHYLLAGLAVVASDTRGQREVAAQSAGAVFLYRAGDTEALAATIDRLVADSSLLADAKRSALLAAREIFCWEKQVPKLLQSVAASIGKPDSNQNLSSARDSS